MPDPHPTKESGSEDLSGKMFAPAEWDGPSLGAWWEDQKAAALLAEAFEDVEESAE